MLRQLFWKDVRICQIPIVAGVVMIVTAYVLAYSIVKDDVADVYDQSAGIVWALRLSIGGNLAVAASDVALAIAAGSIIAIERNEGTASFLGALPLTRIQILGSKVIVLVILVALAAISSWSGMKGAQLLAVVPASIRAEFPLMPIIAYGAASIGTGWCASALLRSSALASFLALALPLIMAVSLSLAIQHISLFAHESYDAAFQVIAWSMGVGLFVIGTVCFLRRVEY